MKIICVIFLNKLKEILSIVLLFQICGSLIVGLIIIYLENGSELSSIYIFVNLTGKFQNNIIMSVIHCSYVLFPIILCYIAFSMSLKA